MNNTAVLDAEADPGPVIAGQYLLGTAGNLHFQNLTDLVSYVLVDPSGTRIGSLVANGGGIQFYGVPLDQHGKWALYREADLDTLGDLAVPVVEFVVTDQAGSLPMGSFVELQSETPTVLADKATPCHGKVANGFAASPDVTGDNVVIVPSGGAVVEISMTWESELTDGQSGQFLLVIAHDENSQVPQSAAANVTLQSETGESRTFVKMEPGHKYRVWCWVKGSENTLPAQYRGWVTAVTA